MSAEVAQVLRDAAALIEPEGRWVKGCWAQDVEGVAVIPGSPDATCWCAEGAIFHASWNDIKTAVAISAAVGRVVGRHLSSFNDAEGTTKDEVIAALRAAADEVQAS